MALATRIKVKRMLGVPSGITRYDETIDDLLTVSDQIVLDETGFSTLTVTQYSELLTVDYVGQNELALKYSPVVSVVALTIGDQLQVLNTDYSINEELGFIELKPLYANFPTGRGVVDITYNAGIDPVPSDLTYASNLIACSLFNQQSHVGFQSEKAGNYTYNLGKNTGSTIPQMANRILNKYRRLFARGMT